MEKEISIIIPAKNEGYNLFWTLDSLSKEFKGIDYEIIVVLNNDKTDIRQQLLKTYLGRRADKLKVLNYNKTNSHWQARNYGAKQAKGEHLLFCDAHIYPEKGSFRNALYYHRNFEGLLHFAQRQFMKPDTSYHYSFDIDRFWGKFVNKRNDDWNILCSSCAAIMVDKERFLYMGGFNKHLKVYGGGEPYIDFKYHLLGYPVQSNPDWVFYHLGATRNYQKEQFEVWFNFLMASYIIGGDWQLNKTYQFFKNRCKSRKKCSNLIKLTRQAKEAGESDRKWINKNAKISYRKLLKKWNYLK